MSEQEPAIHSVVLVKGKPYVHYKTAWAKHWHGPIDGDGTNLYAWYAWGDLAADATLIHDGAA